MKTIDSIKHPYYTVKQIDAHTWCIADCLIEYMYVVEGRDKAAVIDTGMGFHGLRAIVEQLTDKPLIVLNTHGHLDHISANQEFELVYLEMNDLELLKASSSQEYRRADVPVFVRELGHDFPEDVMRQMTDIRMDYQILPIEDGQIFDLGGRTLEAICVPGHTQGCVCFLDAAGQMIFTGDMLCTMGVMLSFENSLTITEFIRTMEKLKARTADKVKDVWPGHHVLPITIDYIDKYIDCARTVLANAAQGIKDPREIVEEGIFGKSYRFNYEDIGLTYTEATRK